MKEKRRSIKAGLKNRAQYAGRKSKTNSKRRAKVADRKPIVIVTGAAGNLGRSLGMALRSDYQIVGLDLRTENSEFPIIGMDLTSEPAVELAFRKFRDAFGSRIASVIHLAAYFDFSGEENELYESVNVEGTRKLLRALRDFEVGQFIYSSTMLVHAPCRPGERIDENQPIEPRWAYPRSKAAAEEVVRAEHGAIPYVILRLAGVYDEHVMVPTLSQQIARIFERDVQSHFYSGSTLVGQAMLHREDMIDAFCRAVDRRDALPPATELLIGEPDAISYDALQDELGYLLHGARRVDDIAIAKSDCGCRILGAAQARARHSRHDRQGRAPVHPAVHDSYVRRPLCARCAARARLARLGAKAPFAR